MTDPSPQKSKDKIKIKSSVSSKETNNYKVFEKLLDFYITQVDPEDELEVRFKTKSYNIVSRIEFDNVLNKLKSIGFENEHPNGLYKLNIWNEFNRNGRQMMSDIRAEVLNFNNIKNYCKTNTIDSENTEVIFTKKNRKQLTPDQYKTLYGSPPPASMKRPGIKPLDFDDYEFRANYKSEKVIDKNSKIVNSIMEGWKNARKKFRYIKRYSFIHPDMPFRIDCSVVKTSTKKYTYNIADSNVFNGNEFYEIEMELLPANKINHIDKQAILSKVKVGIINILSAIQNTKFPISYKEQYGVVIDYINTHSPDLNIQEKLETLIENKYKYHRELTNRKYFVGPSSISLELVNIIEKKEDQNAVSIREPYTVTDKADGERKLLFIASNGNMYLINVNMKVEFTGCKTDNKTIFNTIIDGEHVKYDKKGNYINYYLCFDIYHSGERNYKKYPLMYYDGIKFDIPQKEADKFGNISRLKILTSVVRNLNHKSYKSGKSASLKVSVKTFYNNIEKDDIFKQSQKIINLSKNNGFIYETDGLIFTPINKSVGSSKLGILEKNRTWRQSFKWKPPEFNTIDFLVRTVKDDNKKEIVNYMYENGTNVQSNSNIVKYKTLKLHVGFSKNDGFLNPCETVLSGNIEEAIKWYNAEDSSYRPAPFMPTNPTPKHKIYLCNIKLINNLMMTEDKTQSFEDNTIVEFRYEKTNLANWEWIPIRVRYDKTADYKKTNRNFGNSYGVACSVWRSINFPITEKMISGLDKIPDFVDDNEIYYKKRNTDENITKSLRDFHNKYVKSLLIRTTSMPDNILIDMSVGRGGDIYKWIESRLKFVLGIDYSKDNINNKGDGICSRYIKAKMNYPKVFDGIFLHGSATKNIANGESFSSPKDIEIMKSVLGTGSKNEELGKMVHKYYGVGKDGFDIVSNMFSIHYFFGNAVDIHNFIRNVSENCKIGGYFIGTCYDGEKIFKMLEDIEPNNGISQITNGKYDNEIKVWEVIKKYDKKEFLANESCLGYQIDVYQESINKLIPEYLVHFKYFEKLMNLYGFTLLTSDELKKFNLKGSVGSFETLFKNMKAENKKFHKKYGTAFSMKDYEKKISFLNNYFIFKKKNNVNTEEIMNIALNKQMDIQDIVYVKNQNIQKLKKKFKLPGKNIFETKMEIQKKLKSKKLTTKGKNKTATKAKKKSTKVKTMKGGYGNLTI